MLFNKKEKIKIKTLIYNILVDIIINDIIINIFNIFNILNISLFTLIYIYLNLINTEFIFPILFILILVYYLIYFIINIYL